jgi:uncharacterized protein YecT (DUF1311 family)
MHRTYLVPLLLMLATPSLAADADPGATALSRCLDDPANSSTAGQTGCETQARHSYDHRLNAAYQALLKMLPPAPARQLQEAQRKWIIFRTADANARSALYGTRQGTMYVPMQAHAETNIVRDRTLQLESYLRVMRIEE